MTWLGARSAAAGVLRLAEIDALKRLIATVDSENTGSIKVLEKNQFVRRGTKLGMLKKRAATEYSYQLDR